MSFGFSFQAMGSTIAVQIDLGGDMASVEPVLGALKQDIVHKTECLEQMMSRFRPDSELTELNRRTGRPVKVSPEMSRVLRLSEQMMLETGGLFDPGILGHLERIGYHGEVPGQTGGDGGFSLKWLGPGSVIINRPIDLGGIGKGYTADRLADLIEAAGRRFGLVGYIVDAGGDVVVGGRQKNGDPWNIGVENSLNPPSLAIVLSSGVNNGRYAVCTSSTMRNAWYFAGKQVHHLIDPRTGVPADNPLASVTAIGDRAATTEVLAKAVIIRGRPEWRSWRGEPVNLLSVSREGSIAVTESMQGYVVWSS